MANALSFSLLLIIFQLVWCSEVEKAFVENGIVESNIVRKAPKELLKVSYKSGAVVDLGKELTPQSVKDIPTVEWQAEKGAYYTLLMTDPDAPSRAEPMYKEFRHWAVVNIPENDLSSGKTVFEYIGAGAPKNTGLHRYIFLLYKQPNGVIEYNKPMVTNRSRRDRPKSSAIEFADSFGLGDPIAGNFFQAQYDDYVPLLHAQLSEE